MTRPLQNDFCHHWMLWRFLNIISLITPATFVSTILTKEKTKKTRLTPSTGVQGICWHASSSVISANNSPISFSFWATNFGSGTLPMGLPSKGDNNQGQISKFARTCLVKQAKKIENGPFNESFSCDSGILVLWNEFNTYIIFVCIYRYMIYTVCVCVCEIICSYNSYTSIFTDFSTSTNSTARLHVLIHHVLAQDTHWMQVESHRTKWHRLQHAGCGAWTLSSLFLSSRQAKDLALKVIVS